MSIIYTKEEIVNKCFKENGTLNFKSRVHYKCDDCGKINESSLRAWFAKKKIDTNKKTKIDSNMIDYCLSCAVKHSYTPELINKRKNQFKKNAETKSNLLFYRNCIRCQKLYIRSKNWYKKTCRICYIPGKDWMNRLNPEQKHQLKEKMSMQRKGEKNAMYGKIARHPKAPKIKLGDNIYQFRSNWEAAYAIYLFKNNIKFEYEPRFFKVGPGSTYTPDFFLTEENIYTEIKGYWRGDGKEKVEKFLKLYPELKLKIFMIEELENILGFSPKNKKILDNYLSEFII